MITTKDYYYKERNWRYILKEIVFLFPVLCGKISACWTWACRTTSDHWSSCCMVSLYNVLRLCAWHFYWITKNEQTLKTDRMDVCRVVTCRANAVSHSLFKMHTPSLLSCLVMLLNRPPPLPSVCVWISQPFISAAPLSPGFHCKELHCVFSGTQWTSYVSKLKITSHVAFYSSLWCCETLHHLVSMLPHSLRYLTKSVNLYVCICIVCYILYVVTTKPNLSYPVNWLSPPIHLPIRPPAMPVVARCQEVFEPANLAGWGWGGGWLVGRGQKGYFPNSPVE